MPTVVITMPAYRAELTIAKTLADIPVGVADEIIVVDDASPDDTVRVARELGLNVVVHPKNRGYGGNQKTCYQEALAAGGDIVVLLHPDYQYDPKAVPLLIAPIVAGDADMTFGSRFAGLGNPMEGGMPLYRFIGNRITTVLSNALLGSRFTDMHSGMRAYTRSCLLTTPFLSYSDDFSFDSQFLADAVTLSQRVVEVPIPTRYTRESSSIAVGPSLRYIQESLLAHAKAVARRGRRGKTSPVSYGTSLRRGRLLGGGPRVDAVCPLCESAQRTLLTSDDLVQCPRCGLISAQRMERIPAIEVGGVLHDAAAIASGYAIAGNRLAVVGMHASAVPLDGWDARGVAAGDLEPGHTDGVLFLNIEREEDPISSLKRIKEMLEDRGLLLMPVVDGTGASTSGEARRLLGWARRHLWTKQTTHALLQRSGFRLVEWVRLPGGPPPAALAVARPS